MKIEITGTQTEIESVLFHLDQKYHRIKTNLRRYAHALPADEPSTQGEKIYRQSLHFSLNASEGAKTAPKTRDVDKYPLPVPVAKRPRQLTRDEQARNEAIQWARGVMAEPFIVYDLETDGKEPRSCRPVQICMVDGHSKEILLSSYINPERPIDPGSIRIHGITDDMVQDAPTYADLWPTIDALFGQGRPIAYNAAFDGNVLRNNCIRIGVDVSAGMTFHYSTNCAMEAFARYYGEWKDYFQSYTWKKLEVAARCLKISWQGEAHDAAADALMTVDVIRAMAALDLVE
jgi:DNA polymerase-3 subunit epsilon